MNEDEFDPLPADMMRARTPRPTARLFMRREDALTCEWDTFIDGDSCGNAATTCIIDPNVADDPDYPEGLHVAHLCDEHAAKGLCAMQPEEPAHVR